MLSNKAFNELDTSLASFQTVLNISLTDIVHFILQNQQDRKIQQLFFPAILRLAFLTTLFLNAREDDEDGLNPLLLESMPFLGFPHFSIHSSQLIQKKLQELLKQTDESELIRHLLPITKEEGLAVKHAFNAFTHIYREQLENYKTWLEQENIQIETLSDIQTFFSEESNRQRYPLIAQKIAQTMDTIQNALEDLTRQLNAPDFIEAVLKRAVESNHFLFYPQFSNDVFTNTWIFEITALMLNQDLIVLHATSKELMYQTLCQLDESLTIFYENERFINLVLIEQENIGFDSPNFIVPCTLPNRDDDFFEVDVPADGTCLFYSVMLAVLLPVVSQKEEFYINCDRLFGPMPPSALEELRYLLTRYATNPAFNEELQIMLVYYADFAFRENVANYIRTHPDDFIEFVENADMEHLNAYINSLQKPKTYGDHIEIIAIRDLLGRNILIFQKENKDDQIKPVENDDSQNDTDIILVYTRAAEDAQEKNHYRFIIPQRHLNIAQNPVENFDNLDLNPISIPSSASKWQLVQARSCSYETFQLNKKHKEWKIKVACQQRAYYYRRECEQIRRSLNKANSDFEHDFSSLFPLMVEHIASVLDEQIMEIMNRECKRYRMKHSEKNFTRETARKAYLNYFKDKPHTKKLQQRYPHLFELNNRLMTNYINAMIQALTRIDHDWELLKQAFLSELGPDIHLLSIKSSGSDFHKQGEQVLFLTFTNKEGDEKTIIYKPSPLEADVFLFGDIQRLQTYDKSFEGQYSLVELLNDGLNKQHKKPLPTYLILPCQDNNSNELHRHYGYSECLPHRPWASVDYRKLIEDLLTNKNLGERIDDKLIQDRINELFMAMLKEAAKNPDCDYIARTQEEVNQFSFDCGTVLALMAIARMNDGHCQNFIVVGRRLTPIDGEICFTLMMESILDTACFEFGTGGMNQHSIQQEEYKILFDIMGTYEGSFFHIEKNRLFHLYKLEGEHLIACPLVAGHIIAGFKNAFTLFNEQREALKHWFNNIEARNILVRVPVISSKTLSEQMTFLRKRDFNQTDYEIERMRLLKLELTKYQHHKQSYDIQDSSDNPLVRVPQPVYALYWDSNDATNLLSEYRDGLNIPVYYAYVQEQRLLNSYGNTVFIPLIANEEEMDQPNIPTTDKFFLVSPLELTRQSALRLLDNPALIERLILELINEGRHNNLFKHAFASNIVPDLLLDTALVSNDLAPNL